MTRGTGPLVEPRQPITSDRQDLAIRVSLGSRKRWNRQAMNAILGYARFVAAKRKHETIDHGLLLLVRPDSEVPTAAGARLPTESGSPVRSYVAADRPGSRHIVGFRTRGRHHRVGFDLTIAFL